MWPTDDHFALTCTHLFVEAAYAPVTCELMRILATTHKLRGVLVPWSSESYISLYRLYTFTIDI